MRDMKTERLKVPAPSPRISPPQSRWRRQWEGLREFGFEHILRVLSWLLPSKLFHYNHAILFGATDLHVDAPSNHDYQVRFASKADVDSIGAMEIDRELFLKRLRRGDICAVVTQRDQIVCMNWASTNAIFAPLTGTILKLSSDDVYFYHLLTLPEHRGQGLSRLIYKIQAEYHQSRGHNRIYAGVKTNNTVSIKLHERFGFFRVGESIRVVFLGLNVCWYKSWPHPTPRFHFFFRQPTDIQWT
jgi:GNAT superfamily N-acetyltransferase